MSHPLPTWGACAVLNLFLGPLRKTLVNFWHLIWQEKPPTIVMLINLLEDNNIKCRQYWPDSGSKDFGLFRVTLIDQQVFTDYTIRNLQVEVR